MSRPLASFPGRRGQCSHQSCYSRNGEWSSLRTRTSASSYMLKEGLLVVRVFAFSSDGTPMAKSVVEVVEQHGDRLMGRFVVPAAWTGPNWGRAARSADWPGLCGTLGARSPPLVIFGIPLPLRSLHITSILRLRRVVGRWEIPKGAIGRVATEKWRGANRRRYSLREGPPQRFVPLLGERAVCEPFCRRIGRWNQSGVAHELLRSRKTTNVIHP